MKTEVYSNTMATKKEWEDKGFTVKGDKLVATTSEGKKKPYNKYRNIRVQDGERKFDSKKELAYAQQLDLLMASGEVDWYERQLSFPIKINDKKITSYILDFQVSYSNGNMEYIDVKGFDKKKNKFITTPVFKLKKKLVEAVYGIVIKMV
tara:strand:- start:2639 stop:3088 length:450 start_codon:yes stop_codon:yes gene_type:complete